MPKKYEAIRDKLKAQGQSDKAAKSRAAAIYNAQRKPGQAPVTGHDRRMRRRKGLLSAHKTR